MVDGMPITVQGGEGTIVVAAQTLLEVLKHLKTLGWLPEGELPPYTTVGSYTIPIVKEDTYKMKLFIGKEEYEAEAAILNHGEPIHGKLENYAPDYLAARIEECQRGTLWTNFNGKAYDITALNTEGFFTMKLRK